MAAVFGNSRTERKWLMFRITADVNEKEFKWIRSILTCYAVHKKVQQS